MTLLCLFTSTATATTETCVVEIGRDAESRWCAWRTAQSQSLNTAVQPREVSRGRAHDLPCALLQPITDAPATMIMHALLARVLQPDMPGAALEQWEREMNQTASSPIPLHASANARNDRSAYFQNVCASSTASRAFDGIAPHPQTKRPPATRQTGSAS
jgi:hypothetical protein